MKRIAALLASILAAPAAAQQALPPPIATVLQMHAECSAREADARTAAYLLSEQVKTLQAKADDLQKRLDDATKKADESKKE